MKKSINPGDIILIPTNEKFVVAKVLFCVKDYRNVILLSIFDQVVETNEMPPKIHSEIKHLLYTSQTIIKKGRWLKVGNEPLQKNEIGNTTRIIAGNVWQENEDLGPANEKQLNDIPEMLVLGAKLVEKRAEVIAQS